jgi:hypothetical protein
VTCPAARSIPTCAPRIAPSTGPRIGFQLLWYPATTWDSSLPSFTENADAPVLGGGAVKGFCRWYAGDLDLSDMPAEVLEALAPAQLGEWATWSWFTSASPWLGGAVPAEVLTTDPARVAQAASRFASNAA